MFPEQRERTPWDEKQQGERKGREKKKRTLTSLSHSLFLAHSTLTLTVSIKIILLHPSTSLRLSPSLHSSPFPRSLPLLPPRWFRNIDKSSIAILSIYPHLSLPLPSIYESILSASAETGWIHFLIFISAASLPHFPPSHSCRYRSSASCLVLQSVIQSGLFVNGSPPGIYTSTIFCVRFVFFVSLLLCLTSLAPPSFVYSHKPGEHKALMFSVCIHSLHQGDDVFRAACLCLFVCLLLLQLNSKICQQIWVKFGRKLQNELFNVFFCHAAQLLDVTVGDCYLLLLLCHSRNMNI